jgi:hypothetical protein
MVEEENEILRERRKRRERGCRDSGEGEEFGERRRRKKKRRSKRKSCVVANAFDI